MKHFESGKPINTHIKEGVARIAKVNNLDLVYLFGSCATSTTTPMSDVDIAVLLSKSSTQNNSTMQKSHLITEFSRVFMTDRVDLTILNTAPYSLSFTVIKEGLLLFSANEETRENFEMRALFNYFDFQPFEKLYFREMEDQIHQNGEINH